MDVRGTGCGFVKFFFDFPLDILCLMRVYL